MKFSDIVTWIQSKLHIPIAVVGIAIVVILFLFLKGCSGCHYNPFSSNPNHPGTTRDSTQKISNTSSKDTTKIHSDSSRTIINNTTLDTSVNIPGIRIVYVGRKEIPSDSCSPIAFDSIFQRPDGGWAELIGSVDCRTGIVTIRNFVMGPINVRIQYRDTSFYAYKSDSLTIKTLNDSMYSLNERITKTLSGPLLTVGVFGGYDPIFTHVVSIGPFAELHLGKSFDLELGPSLNFDPTRTLGNQSLISGTVTLYYNMWNFGGGK